MTLTELAIKRPSLIVVLFAILGILGLFGYTQLNYNLLPKFSPPFISISNGISRVLHRKKWKQRSRKLLKMPCPVWIK